MRAVAGTLPPLYILLIILSIARSILEASLLRGSTISIFSLPASSCSFPPPSSCFPCLGEFDGGADGVDDEVDSLEFVVDDDAALHPFTRRVLVGGPARRGDLLLLLPLQFPLLLLLLLLFSQPSRPCPAFLHLARGSAIPLHVAHLISQLLSADTSTPEPCDPADACLKTHPSRPYTRPCSNVPALSSRQAATALLADALLPGAWSKLLRSSRGGVWQKLLALAAKAAPALPATIFFQRGSCRAAMEAADSSYALSPSASSLL
jgi:hypothetical protein